MASRENVIGQRFGRLLVIADLEGKLRLCKCDCGGYAKRNMSHLRRTKMAGCNKCARERNNLGTMKHGDWNGERSSKLYNIWYSMRSRCRNPKVYGYKYYGGNGIIVCEEWQQFSNFRKWALENNYIEGLSIERINPESNYEPSNCVWITRSENSRRMNTHKRIRKCNEALEIIKINKIRLLETFAMAA